MKSISPNQLTLKPWKERCTILARLLIVHQCDPPPRPSLKFAISLSFPKTWSSSKQLCESFFSLFKLYNYGGPLDRFFLTTVDCKPIISICNKPIKSWKRDTDVNISTKITFFKKIAIWLEVWSFKIIKAIWEEGLLWLISAPLHLINYCFLCHPPEALLGKGI